MTIIGVASDNVITVDVHSLCRLRGQVDRRATDTPKGDGVVYPRVSSAD